MTRESQDNGASCNSHSAENGVFYAVRAGVISPPLVKSHEFDVRRQMAGNDESRRGNCWEPLQGDDCLRRRSLHAC
jgi:hypothetical protein